MELSGINAKLRISETAITSASDGQELINIEVSTINEMVELSERVYIGQGGAKNRTAINKDFDFDLNGSYFTDNAAQNLIIPGARLYVGVWLAGYAAAGTCYPVIIESVNKDIGTENITFSATCRGTGLPSTITI